jgi:hypothetical protein
MEAKMGDRNDNIEFLKHKCEIYGRLDDTVYRRKRNGELTEYDYEYIPKYAATVLSKRTEIIIKVLGTISNLREVEYQDISKRLFYYTPYLLYAGKYSFTANTFYKISKSGEYELVTGNVSTFCKLSPRTMLKNGFREIGSHNLRCYYEDELYSEREVIVIPPEIALETTYEAWYEDNLLEILERAVPDFESMMIYHRHLKRKDIYANMSGKADDNLVILKSDDPDIMFSRKNPSHSGNEQTRYFCDVYPHITECWKNVQPDFMTVWRKLYQFWYEENIRDEIKAFTGLHLWTSIVFKAAANLSFDLNSLSPDNWLPGVITLGNLLTAGDIDKSGLSAEELNTNIFELT